MLHQCDSRKDKIGLLIYGQLVRGIAGPLEERLIAMSSAIQATPAAFSKATAYAFARATQKYHLESRDELLYEFCHDCRHLWFVGFVSRTLLESGRDLSGDDDSALPHLPLGRALPGQT